MLKLTPLPYVALTLTAFGLAAAHPPQAQAAPLTPAQAEYKFTTIDDLSSTGNTAGTVITGINDSRDAVGYYIPSNGGTTSPARTGFFHSGSSYNATSGSFDTSSGSFTDIKISTDTNPITQANGINDSGQIAGDYKDQTSMPAAVPSPYRGFEYNSGIGGGATYPINAPGSNFTLVNGINSAGTLVGYYGKSVNSNFQITGFYGNSSTFTTINAPAGSTFIDPSGINDNGQLVGFYQDGGGTHGFLDNLTGGSGGFTTINLVGATSTIVKGINNKNQIVGEYLGADGYYHGFLDSFAGGFGSLNTDYTTLDEPSFIPGPPNPSDPLDLQGTFISGINNFGDIAGDYTVANAAAPDGITLHGFYAAAPEPSQTATLVFAAFGLAGLLLRAGKKAAAKRAA